MAGAGRQLRVRRGGPADAVLLRTHLGLYAARQGAGQSASLVQAARAVSSRGEGRARASRRSSEQPGQSVSAALGQCCYRNTRPTGRLEATSRELSGFHVQGGFGPAALNRGFQGTVDAPPKRDSRS